MAPVDDRGDARDDGRTNARRNKDALRVIERGAERLESAPWPKASILYHGSRFNFRYAEKMIAELRPHSASQSRGCTSNCAMVLGKAFNVLGKSWSKTPHKSIANFEYWNADPQTHRDHGWNVQ
jgi:hypothetical protein